MTDGQVRRVGLIGLGKMGLPMARHVQAAGYQTVVQDIGEPAMAAAAAAGLNTVATAREVAAESDFIVVVVGFDAEVESVLFGASGIAAAARPGLVVGIASTIAPRTMTRLGKMAEETGIVLLDMPLTRGEPAAEAGNLLVMVGGNEAAYRACKPVIDCFASSIFHLGEAGAGQVGKMVNNMILWACTTANLEGFEVAAGLGVDSERLREALLQSSASNWAMETKAETSKMPWAEKDMRIALAEADRLKLSIPVAGVVTEAVKKVKQDLGWPTPEIVGD